MIVAIDASVVIDLLNPKLKGDHRAILDDLVAALSKERAKLLIPAPAFTEVMIRADGARERYQQLLSKNPFIQVAPFDKKAATECALILADVLSKREKSGISKAKFKFDWQIVATAITNNADIIYSEDGDIERYAKYAKIRFVRPSSLPIPESAKQRALDLDAPDDLV
jgi:predicted nucleic acid-binding protein